MFLESATAAYRHGGSLVVCTPADSRNRLGPTTSTSISQPRRQLRVCNYSHTHWCSSSMCLLSSDCLPLICTTRNGMSGHTARSSTDRATATSAHRSVTALSWSRGANAVIRTSTPLRSMIRQRTAGRACCKRCRWRCHRRHHCGCLTAVALCSGGGTGRRVSRQHVYAACPRPSAPRTTPRVLSAEEGQQQAEERSGVRLQVGRSCHCTRSGRPLGKHYR